VLDRIGELARHDRDLEGTSQERPHGSECQHATAGMRERQAGQERDRATEAPRQKKCTE
jgi:hypothetical protein